MTSVQLKSFACEKFANLHTNDAWSIVALALRL
jgi:hypothetical protein